MSKTPLQVSKTPRQPNFCSPQAPSRSARTLLSPLSLELLEVNTEQTADSEQGGNKDGVCFVVSLIVTVCLSAECRVSTADCAVQTLQNPNFMPKRRPSDARHRKPFLNSDLFLLLLQCYYCHNYCYYYYYHLGHCPTAHSSESLLGQWEVSRTRHSQHPKLVALRRLLGGNQQTIQTT